MRIAYCTNVRLPNERAHGHQIARVCDALVKLGHEVRIFAPHRENPVRASFHDFHNVDRRVQLTLLGRFDPIDCPLLPKWLQLFLLNCQLRWELRHALRQAHRICRFDLLYTRTPALLSTLLGTEIPVVLELHAIPQRFRSAFIQRCHSCVRVVCLTASMRDALKDLGIEAHRLVVAPDAVDLDEIHLAGRQVPLQEFGVTPPSGVKIIGYVGQIESMGLSKGIPELLDALVSLQKSGHGVHLVTMGPPSRDDRLEARLAAAGTRLGFHPHVLIPHLLRACDVLVYPAPKTAHPYFTRDTSPLKIFEYMAAGRPIVAADLPPVRDILDETTAFLCPPGDPKALADTIAQALDNPEEARRRAQNARRRVENHTWEKRMTRILRATSSPPRS